MPYEKTTVWVAKIVMKSHDWNTRYETSPWDDISLLRNVTWLWKKSGKILGTLPFAPRKRRCVPPTRDDWNEDILSELAELCYYNEDWFVGDWGEEKFREELAF